MEATGEVPEQAFRGRLLVATTGGLLAAATILLPQPVPPSWPALGGLLVAFGLVMALVTHPRHRELMDRWGYAVGVALIVGLVAATGGVASHYQDLFLLIVLSTAAIRTTRRLLLHAPLVVAGAMAPLLYDPAAGGVWATDLVVDIGIWAAVAAAVHLQGRSLFSHLQAAKDGEARFRAMAMHSVEGIYEIRLRPVPRFDFVNPALEALTGFTADDLARDATLRAGRIHPEDAGQLDVLERGWTDPSVPPAEFRWEHPDGSWLWLASKETAVRDPAGRVVGVQGTVRDVSAQKKLEQSLRDALRKEQAVTRRLRELHDMKNAFLSALSHELRTPLTSILGYSQVLVERRAALTEEQVADFHLRLARQARQLDRLLADLLDVDRLTRDATRIERQPTDLFALTTRVVAQTDTTSHRLVLHGDPVVLDVDAPKVERIIENLVVNAIRHTPAGTAVVVRVGPLGDGAEIVVDDAGPGVPPEMRPTIFEPFVQGRDAAGAPSPGTGIGLSLVAQLARLHGGHAEVTERPGGGARFRVVLRPDDTGPRAVPATSGRTAIAR